MFQSGVDLFYYWLTSFLNFVFSAEVVSGGVTIGMIFVVGSVFVILLNWLFAIPHSSIAIGSARKLPKKSKGGS